MTDKKLITNDIRKALIKQQLAEQRYALQEQLQPLVRTSKRIKNLFSTQQTSEKNKGKVAAVTGAALLLAVLGKRRGGWLGQAARYLIINYPGILHRLIK